MCPQICCNFSVKLASHCTTAWHLHFAWHNFEKYKKDPKSLPVCYSYARLDHFKKQKVVLYQTVLSNIHIWPRSLIQIPDLSFIQNYLNLNRWWNANVTLGCSDVIRLLDVVTSMFPHLLSLCVTFQSLLWAL